MAWKSLTKTGKKKLNIFLIVTQNNTIRINWVLSWFIRPVECSPMARETWVQFKVESYQRLKKWYLISLCLTLSIIRYVSMANPRKEWWPSLHLGVVAIKKGAYRSPSTMVGQFYWLTWFIKVSNNYSSKKVYLKLSGCHVIFWPKIHFPFCLISLQ